MTNEELVALIQAGERDRLAELWAQEERLVQRYAYSWLLKYEGRGGVTLDDLMQHGFIAMVHAVDRTNLSMGYKFNTLFVLCLKSEFTRASGLRTKHQKMDPIHDCTSLDTPLNDEADADSLVAFIPDPSAELMFDESERSQAIKQALRMLTEREFRVIWLHFFCGLSLDQVGKEMGIIKSSAHRIEAKALRKLRHPVNAQKLRDFV